MKKQMSFLMFFMMILFLFQGCAVYKSTPVTIEEATKEGYPVKIRTIDSKTATYHHIEFNDGKYYGVKHVNRQKVIVPLEKGEINSIQKKDKTRSTIGNVAIIWPIIGLALLAAGAVTVF